MADAVLLYAQGIGFPQTHMYGEDAGIIFGSYSGTGSERSAKLDVMEYAQENGFPDAALSADGTKLEFNA